LAAKRGVRRGNKGEGWREGGVHLVRYGKKTRKGKRVPTKQDAKEKGGLPCEVKKAEKFP